MRQQLTLFDIPTTLPAEYYPGFLHNTEADALLAHCKSLAWQQNEIRMLGKNLQVPRLECMYGEERASYVYSGSVNLEARPWTEELLQLRDRITAFCNHEFDIVIGNRYRNGQDSISWHSDNEASMGLRPAIASMSLGACRKFSVKSKAQGSKATHFWLEHGSLLLMLLRSLDRREPPLQLLSGCQEGYVHQLPKDDKCFGERINLTFRPYGRLK